MATHWKEWEKKIGSIFQQIGYRQVPDPEKPSGLEPRSFCLERLNPDMQVDVFVRVNENTWIHIECRDRRNATIRKWLHEIKGRSSERLSKLRKETKKTGHRVFCVAATSLRDIDGKTQVAADNTGVALWHHGIVDYLLAISRGAGSQVEDLVLQRCGIKLPAYPKIQLQVLRWPSTESWLVGFVSPLQIAHATFVYQRGQGFGENAYQRFIKPQRITEIAEFVRSGKGFPNSVVIALPAGTKIPAARVNELLNIEVPGEPEGLKIIDGQHRFFGALASGKNPKLLCTFVKADDLDQALMFAKVNGKQVSVSKSQLVSLFGIPGFAAKIASGVSSKDQAKVDREEGVYRTLERLNAKGPLAGKLNFYAGRPATNTVPFKFLFDTLISISKQNQSGFNSLSGVAVEKGAIWGDQISDFLDQWARILGRKNFDDPGRWFQSTMLGGILLTYPDCAWQGGKATAAKWLTRQNSFAWSPKPEAYRGAAGARSLAKVLCRKLSIQPKFL